MWKKFCSLFFAMFFIVQAIIPYSVCAGEQEQEEFQKVLQEINQKNEALDVLHETLVSYRYDFNSHKPKLTNKDVDRMEGYDKNKVKKRIALSNAKKGIAWLFRLFRSQYGAYYYGGDAAFGSAKRTILKNLGAKKTVSVKKYQKLYINIWSLS